MQRQVVLIVLAIFTIVVRAYGAGPSTQPADALFLDLLQRSARESAAKASEPFQVRDFDLKYRELTPSPGWNATPKYTFAPTPAQRNPVQNWSSFNFNGQTVWNRPSILNITPTPVKDRSTGALYIQADAVEARPLSQK